MQLIILGESNLGARLRGPIAHLPSPLRVVTKSSTHASLLIMAGFEVVSERLGRFHPAFTMHTDEDVLLGMGGAPPNSSWH